MEIVDLRRDKNRMVWFLRRKDEELKEKIAFKPRKDFLINSTNLNHWIFSPLETPAKFEVYKLSLN